MSEVVGVRFRQACRVYYFDPAGNSLEVNDAVVVNSPRGLELGTVVIAPREVVANEITEPLKPIVRKADPDDEKRAREFADKEKEVLQESSKVIQNLGLPMRLRSAEYNLDGSRLTIFFSAGDRVDFRELVRELNSRFKTRVELRQIGPRDETKMIGGFGRCGCRLCCSSFLSEFAPVSIRMAKEQDLPLNPMKISGTCGRLLCCLVYENEQYRELKSKLPRKGQRVTTALGPAVVAGSSPLKQTVLVELETQAIVELPLNEITLVS